MPIERAQLVQPGEIFDNADLNKLTQQLMKIGNDVTKLYENLKRDMRSAFIKRWEAGKLLHEHQQAIIDECGTMKNFCEMTGFTESVISNNMRGYRNLLEAGANKESDVIKLLDTKKIEPTSRNFEKIGTLLLTSGNEPETTPVKRTKAEKAVKQLEQLNEQVEQIKQTFIPESSPKVDPVIHEEISTFSEYIQDMRNHALKMNPVSVGFRSETYTEYIRNYPRDVVTMEPITGRADPHHANEFYAKVGEKINDLWQIPVSRETHQSIENGEEAYDKATLNETLVELMANYIMLMHKSLGIK